MVWKYRSPIPVGEKGDNLLVHMIFTCSATSRGRGGGSALGILWVGPLIFQNNQSLLVDPLYQYRCIDLLNVYRFTNNCHNFVIIGSPHLQANIGNASTCQTMGRKTTRQTLLLRQLTGDGNQPDFSKKALNYCSML
jgi:hypothetical protein